MRVARRLLGIGGWALLVFLQTRPLAGQSAPSLRTPASGHLTDGIPVYQTPAGTSLDVLHDMVSRSAIIFVGTVTAVRRPTDDAMRGAAGGAIVEVDFSVAQGVLGVAAGETYAMREWAGLWRDAARFTIGQRLLMLIHAPGPGGLSSPVDGLDGAIPVRTGPTPYVGAAGAVHAQAQPAEEPVASETVDLRWLEARTLRAVAYADETVADPGAARAESVVRQTDKDTADNGSFGPLTKILGLLAAWQRTPSASN